MLKPITIEFSGVERVVKCLHQQDWPPFWSKFGTAEQMRSRFSVLLYERAKTWETACGLQEMRADKCRVCPMARFEDDAPVVASQTVPIVSDRRLKQRK